MTDWFSILGAFGLGSVVTTVVSAFASERAKRKERNFQERKEAYIGLLETWYRQEAGGFQPGTEFEVGHWVSRSELVASEKVHGLLNTWMSSEPGSSERVRATQLLKVAMREDLL